MLTYYEKIILDDRVQQTLDDFETAYRMAMCRIKERGWDRECRDTKAFILLMNRVRENLRLDAQSISDCVRSVKA